MTNLDLLIDEAKKICILGHINPDGDCIGSTLGLYNYIKNKYDDKFVRVYLEKASDKFNILEGFKEISQDLNDAIDFDLCIVCDCGSEERIKDFVVYLKRAKKIMIIDHHETNNIKCENIILDKNAPATSELVYKNIDKKYIDKKVAECLYVGIAHDTGVFRYSNTNKNTLIIVSELIDKGINFSELLDITMFKQKFNQKVITANIINRAKFLCKGKVLFSWTNKEEVISLSLDNRDIDMVVGYMRETIGIDIAVFAYEIGVNIYKISLRSNGEKINCADFSKKYGGGGHKKAAGFTLKMSIEEIEKFLSENISEIFNE